MMLHIEENNIKYLTEKLLLNYFDDEEISVVIDFLCNEKIIKKINLDLEINKRVYLISNNEKFTDVFKKSTNGLIKDLILVDDYKSIDIEKNSLIYIFMNPYNLNDYIKINEYLKNYI